MLKFTSVLRQLVVSLALICAMTSAATATPFTTTVPGTGVQLPAEYPEAGGTAIVLTGVNGNLYYQFTDPTGAFRGFQNNGQPAAFRGNPFTINDPNFLDCGFSDCSVYFGGAIAQIDIRFTAYDGDTQPGGFDENDIDLLINGFNVGDWSGRPTEATNLDGTTSFGINTGFGNGTFDTGWFSSNDTALLANILATGQTVAQVLDDDPNDNYWDFRRGPSLAGEELRTVAPGYDLTKTRRDAGDAFGVSGSTTYLNVGDQIIYDYLVRNIGSVVINNVTVTDDKIGPVTCTPTSLEDRPNTAPEPDSARCTGVYTVTQADVDAGTLTNVAMASGEPEFGELGTLSDSVTLTAADRSTGIDFEKTVSPTTFTAVGDQITYTMRAINTGKVTLSGVTVTDPMFPTQTCNLGSIAPLSTENTDNDAQCTIIYTVTQADIDNAAAGTAIVNTAMVTATDPDGGTLNDNDSATATGPTAMPAMTVVKTATPQTFSTVGETINFAIVVTNTGNVTWTTPVSIDDPLTTNEMCPNVTVAPGASVTCTASYPIDQTDLDNETLTNTATASITVNGETAGGMGSETILANVMPELTVEKSLSTGPDPVTSTTDQLVYTYLLTNDGNVVLNNINLTDDKVGLTCPAATLAAGATMTCTSAAYTVTLDDLNAGFVTNTATATSTTGQGGAVPDAMDDYTVLASQDPSLAMTKVARPIPAPGLFEAGATVTYDYTVINDGNVTLAGPFSVTDDKIAGAIACGTGPLDPGQTRTCSADYVVQPADVGQGFVTNSATVSDGTNTSDPVTETVPDAGTPGISVVKSAVTASFGALNDPVVYSFRVTNTGDTVIDATAQPITINDAAFAASGDAIDCSAQPSPSLVPGAFFDCTGTYTGISQADIDAGSFTNTASASFPFGGGTVTSSTSSDTVPSSIVPALTLTKSAPVPAEFTAVGQELVFTFTVQNDTAQTIATATVTDPLIPALSCVLTNIGPNASQQCTGSYFVDQDDMDAGVINNTASASGTSASGANIPSSTASATVTLPAAAIDRSFTLDKQTTNTTFAAVGDRIDYVFEVVNDGNQTLTDIVITDTTLGYTCNVPPLAPGDTDRSCFADYTITQTDIDNGSFVNAASATATGAPTQNDSETVTGPARLPSFDFTKTASGGFTDVGDMVRYSFAVVNTGNVTLTNIDIADTSAAIAPQTFACTIATLAPGTSDTTSCFFDYTVRQQDLDTGSIANTASVMLDTPLGTPLTDTDSAISTGPAEMIDLVVDKVEETPDGVFADAVTEAYVFTVTNNSNVTLKGISLADPLTGFSCTLADLPPAASTTFCDDGTTQLRGTYTPDQDDVDRGSLTNVVTVTANTDQTPSVTAMDQLTLLGPDQLPALSIAKSSPPGTFDAVGDVISYSYRVTNAGNITINSPITVADDRTTVSCPAVPLGGIAPGGFIDCTATYAVTQTDLNDGNVTNIASASTSQPVVPSAMHPTGVASVTSPTDTVIVNASQMPLLSIDKRVKAGTPATYSQTSSVVTFEFVVTNTGNETANTAILINDMDLTPAQFTCGPAGLAPGQSVTCEATWSPDQGDINTGSFTNSATAQADFDSGTITSPSDSATVAAIQSPGLSMTKVPDPNQVLSFADMQMVTYIYTVTNTGNETINGPINVIDNLINPTVPFACDAGPLNPGDVVSCNQTYQLTVDDVRLGSVTNIADASGTTTGGDPVTSDPTSATIPQNANPAIAITKAVTGVQNPDMTAQATLDFNEVGDIIEYTYTVTNNSLGNPNTIPPQDPPAIASDVDIVDDKLAAPLVCFRSSGTNVEINVGETVTCTEKGYYTVTQADLDAVDGTMTNGFVTNNAFGTSSFGTVDPLVSDPVQVTVPGVANPAMSVVKSVTSGPNPAAVGNMLEFTIVVSNTGNQTLSGVVVTDPMIPVLSCEIASTVTAQPLVLAVGSAATCVGNYTVTQADVDAQTLSNIATASGTNPQGTPVTQTGTTTHPVVAQDESIAIAKTVPVNADGQVFTDVNQDVTYSIRVENDGNVTLLDVEVTDILFPGQVCVIGTLAPGAVDTSCEFVYTIAQEDLDRGELNNEASVTAVTDTPSATPVDATDNVNGDGPPRVPTISVNKDTVATTFSAMGDVIPFTFVVANTGNVTIEDQPVVTDPKIAAIMCDPIPAAGLAPIEFIQCTGNYTITQIDVDAGMLTNSVTATVINPVDRSMTIDATDSVTITGSRTPSFTVAKAADDATDVVAGQDITYSYTIQNTGNVTLTNVTLDDQHTTQAGTNALTITGNPVASIAPDEIVVLTATYTVTQDDLDAGTDIINIVTANVTPPVGVTPPAPETATETVTVADPDPSLEVLKTVTPPATLAAGQTATFTITVRNDGNVSLTNILLSDTLGRNDGSTVSPAPVPVLITADTGTVGALDVDEVWTYEVAHVLTQDDMDAGGLSNSAIAFGDDPFGTNVNDTSDTGTGTGSTATPLIIPPLPAIEGEKTITSTALTLGATVRFEITATNTGNVTLNSVAVSSDTLLRADGTPLTLASGPSFFTADMGSGAGTLQVGETATFRATYVLTQDDIDAGGINNQAVVTGTPPVGGPVTDVTDDGDPADGNTTTDLVIPAVPALDMAKALTAGGPTFDTVDQMLTYTFTVTNTGNVTITDPITINDPLIAGVTCAATPLAPLASLACTGTYAVTQQDIDDGFVLNTATAQTGTTISDPDSETVLAQQNPAMETAKAAVSITVDGTTYTTLESQYFVTGAVVGYEFTVTNTGNQTLVDPITVSDNLIAAVTCPALPTGGLAPMDSIVCSGDYTVSQTDVDNRSVTNLASATDGTTTSPLVSETIPDSGTPLLDTTKTVTAVTNPDMSASASLTFDEVGDVLTYTFTITNAGTVAFVNDVTIVDDRIAASPLTCFTPTGADPDFRPGEMLTCTADYTVTQIDLDAGEVVNQAYAETISAGMPIVSAPVSETTLADDMPAIEITKSAATLPITGVDQVLTYTLTLNNTGNQTLRDVRATDPLLPNMTCMITELAPGMSDTCSDTYTVTQDDIDAGELVNTADARAITPSGAQVTDNTSLTLAVPAAMPMLTLAKSATPDPFGAVGSSITYIFEVGNTGNVTLFDVTVTDPALDAAYSCVVPRLDVGTTDATCTYSYEITQDDKDAGEIMNTAQADAVDPFNTPVTITDTITTPAQPAVPGIEATKTVSGATALNSPITYTLTLRNTGDVTLNVGTITDTMTRIGNNTGTSLDTAFGGLTGDTDGDTLLDVTEVWTLTATHILTQADIDQGGLSNTITVEATDPFGTVVDDVTDNGIDNDGNTTDDPTQFVIVPGPDIEAVKTVSMGGSVAGDTVSFQIAVTNIGDVTLTDITVTDTLRRADGTLLLTDAPATEDDPAQTSIIPGAVKLFTFSHVLTQADVDSGGLMNSATATGTPPSGPPVSDVSDNGDDTDGTLSVDGTSLLITPMPAFDVEKTARMALTDPIFAGDVMTFDITIANRGNVTLTNLAIADNLTNFAGDVQTVDAITFNTGASETQIGAGQENTYIVTYTLAQEDIDSGGVENSFTASVTTPAGVPLTDVSDDGDDGDGNTLDDPTRVAITRIPGLAAEKRASVPVRITGTRFAVTFDMDIQNIGNITETDLVATDDLAAFVAPATLISTTTPVVTGFLTGGGNPNYNGVSDTNLLVAGTSILPVTTGTMQITVVYDTANGSPAQDNVVSVYGANATAPVTGVAGVVGSADADIFASKTVTPDNADLGATVSYTMTFENRIATAEAGLTFVDDLPSGITVNPDTVLYNGAASPAPTIADGQMIWENASLAAFEVVTITFDARITGGGGEITNRAYVLNSDGDLGSNVAEATIRRRIESVFECTDIIGKVFDDRNGNGYQDGVAPRETGITDQTYYGSKGKGAPVITEPDHEPGLANARLFTVDGTMITTDEYGRFSVPCAALPAAGIGSNFTLKLDEASLPTGYRVTTENPRVMRVTPGTVTKMNFGASISRVVEIDLMSAAFDSGSATPSAALIAGVDQLVAALAEAPSVLQLTYYRDGEPRELARARLRAVAQLVRTQWRQSGVYQLEIETTIQRVQ